MMAIRRNPELGFKEFRTARLVEETFASLGLKPTTGLALTGVRAEARGAKDGPTFALLGELDALVVVGHPVADPKTGDVEWRVQQARTGKLEFLGGKPELLRLGHFDDVDMAMMIHTTPQAEIRKAGISASNNGCIVKTVRYVGRAS